MSRVICGNCGQIPGMPFEAARSTYLWSNQHGYGKRVFCYRCGYWTDVHLYNKGPRISEYVRKPDNWKYKPYIQVKLGE